MANEIQIITQLNIVNQPQKVNERSSKNFRFDAEGDNKGPSPGALTIPTTGEDVSFIELSNPGPCRITNKGTSYVDVGVWDGIEFMPLFEIGPGESYVNKISRNLGKSYGLGTGTTDSGNTMRLKSYSGAVIVSVEAYNR